ncbi:hypothetical protein [Cryptosporangium sp. NPDC051539]|uniref:hypothetical protein n=1 Tax=Cryptosporangium sp. NPDC051539 TaxID=3363962 RepID=UPI0037A08331
MTATQPTRWASDHHHGSHRGLLRPVPVSVPTETRLEMIAVPTSRPASYLAEAVRLAGNLGCMLLVLASGKCSVPEIERRYGHLLDGRLIVVDVPTGYARYTSMFRFEADDVAAGASTRPSDISVKRNVGLIVARALGVRRLFFVDDDIVVPDWVDVFRAASALGKHRWAAGMNILGYPDNSVVCHINRETGGHQETFVGAGALMVNPQRVNGFFPNVYNEDWFFLLDCAAERAVVTTGTAFQRPYDPLSTPSRARREEFGDVLAESLFWQLDQGSPLEHLTEKFWAKAIERRRFFVDDVRARTERLDPETARRMIAALSAATGAHREFTARVCADYVRAWQADRVRWARDLPLFSTPSSLGEVLDRLGLPLYGSADRLATVTVDRSRQTRLLPAPLANASGMPVFGLASPASLAVSVDSAIAKAG